MAQQKRDNQYYMKRLQKDRPDLYADIRADKISVNKARQLAGLGATRNRLNELKNSWDKASLKEQADFASWAGLTAALAFSPPAVPAVPATHSAFDADGVMLPWARLRIEEIMTRRGLTPSNLADELGIIRLDASVMRALKLGSRLRILTTRAATDAWLVKNASV